MEKSNYQKLIVRQKSMDLIEQIYKITGLFPKEETYGLISQIRRCAISIASNIAEGNQRGTSKDKQNFLRIAKGSTAELETQIIIAKRLGYIKEAETNEILTEISEILKMLSGFIVSLK
ncbi:MAG: four helix bundle protein [Candidatus Absconditabacteria bacterium]|nr:four helix bundle protein [Candidatus Absconditabacteria bacterium]